MIILWRSLDLPLIKFKMELHFLWSTKCVISEIDRTSEVHDNPHIISTIAQVLSALSSNAVIRNIKQGFKRTIYWNKYWSEITAQPKTTI